MQVFPARAGMDRASAKCAMRVWSVPRASGDGPRCTTCVLNLRTVFPARAGMDRRTPRWTHERSRVPRASGDGPPTPTATRALNACSPRERGWTGNAQGLRAQELVFPARAGMDRWACRSPGCSGRCSPRERGWTDVGAEFVAGDSVFPARAGMDLQHLRPRWPTSRVPRASGDGPVIRWRNSPQRVCSPRERGWTAGGPVPCQDGSVFPARAGMDRSQRPWRCRMRRVPAFSG